MEKTYSFEKNASLVHKQVVQFFKKNFPSWSIIQNKPIKIDNKSLYIDVFCQTPFKIAVEVQGIQHFKYIPFFHRSQDNFKQAQKNDDLKKQYCEMNDIIYLAVNVEGFDCNNFKNKLMEAIKNVE